MNETYYRYLCCPDCQGQLDLTVDSRGPEGIQAGTLKCTACPSTFPIVDAIPRFVPLDNYSESFRYEWDFFHEQRSHADNREAFLGLAIKTILRRTGWDENFYRGKLVLECGCGGGHETEALLAMGANVISFDYSGGVDNVLKLNAGHDNLLIVQADIAHLPFRQRSFDIVHCHRVLMHTPSPEASFRSIAKQVKPGGALFAHSYSSRPRTYFNYKYLLRPITTRMSHARLIRIIRKYGRPLHRLCGWTKRNHLGFLERMIPFENYERLGPRAGIHLSEEAWFEFACMGVFDALTPAYDQPQSWRRMRRWFESEQMDNIIVRRKKPVVITGVYAGPEETD